MIKINLEGAEITGVEHAKESRVLAMKATLCTGETCQLVFVSVEWWELCSFGLQNVLFSIDSYNKQTLTEGLIDDHDIDKHYVKLVGDGHHDLFMLNASMGLSGWIIAANMTVKSLTASPSASEPPTDGSSPSYYAGRPAGY